MFGVRIHGRGGQGVVTTAGLLAVAAFSGGRYAQAATGGAWEHPGLPVTTSCRIDGMPIHTHEPVARPDAVIICDPGLTAAEPVLAGVSPEGYVLVNSSVGLGELGLGDRFRGLCRDRVLVVPATGMALDYLGRPLPGAVMLGGLAALTGVVTLGEVAAALHERFSRAVAGASVTAAQAGHDFVRAEREALTGAQAG